MTPAALAELVIQAAETVDGARVRRGRRRLDIDLSHGDARVRLELSLATGSCCPTLRATSRERVADALATMCAVRSAAVDVPWRRSNERRPARGKADRAVPALPVGRHRPAARLALRGRGGSVRTRNRGGRRRRAADYDRRITEAAEGWTADRLGAIERNILRIALYELDGEEVPQEVAIDEAVNLAKRYATDDAARLVNGILGRIVRERGLVSAEDSLARAEELLARLEKTRAELERLTQADEADKALDVLTELSELSKAIEDELQQAKRNAEADAEP